MKSLEKSGDFLVLILVAPGGTLAQLGEASFARGGWEARDIKQKPY